MPQWPPGRKIKIGEPPFETGKPSGPYLFKPGLDGISHIVGEWDGYICCTPDGGRELRSEEYWDLPP